jgi:hypothetical protein
VILGIFEIFLGATLLISPFDYGPVVYWAVTLWAFLGGLILFNEAWQHRKHLKEKGEAQQEEAAPKSDAELGEESS